MLLAAAAATRVCPDVTASVRLLYQVCGVSFSIRRRFDVPQRVRLCLFGGLGRPESRQYQASEVHFVFPFVTVHKTTSTSFRRSLMRKWRNGTFLSLGRVLTILTQEQEDYIGVKVEGPFQRWTLQLFRFMFHSGFRFSTAMEKNRRGSRSGRTLRGSSSSAGRPRHESSISKNYLESSSIEKNCLRSSSTWTSSVHRVKESPTKSKAQKPD